MAYLRLLSSAEQVAQYLRGQLMERVWTGMMPGGNKLARELGVGANTIEAALKILENEGLLVNQGRRRGREITLKAQASKQSKMQISILLGEPSDRHQAHMLELVSALEDEGHSVKLASKTREEMANNVERIAEFVNVTGADAWIVFAATREVLQWFEDSKVPSFAFAGRANHVKLPSIGPDKIAPLRIAIRKLVGLGHRNIVNLCRPLRRIPEPGLFERAFLEELKTMGIQTGPYHLPNWDENIDDFHRMLDSIFALTPPTAIFIDEGPFVTATLQFCIKKGLQIPEDVSIICTDSDPSFAWCKPSIAHIHWEAQPVIRRMVQWADDVTLGKKDLKKGFSKAEFVEGGSIGPAPTEQ
jgi:DNA-binding LacI/PurR family transcriptional regulator